jgi:ATP-dependent RNA helicase DHX8/PRP22
VAEEAGCVLGEEVGYSIRFEDKVSERTRVKFMTDGMLMREYLADASLRRYSVLILDEAHERTINTDVLFGLLKRLVQTRRDLRIIVTSATLDAEKFSSFFFGCPIFEIPGRAFPVHVLHAKEPVSDYVDAAVAQTLDIHLRAPPGDVLIFLTGEEEINSACDILYTRIKALGSRDVPELVILPAYAALPSEMQSRIFEPAPRGGRKCIVATNIAEASLTIDGIRFVIDPGFSKQKVYDPKLGMDSLVVVPISQASAEQRKGRAGRTAEGTCYRLYTKDAFDNEMLPMSVPEIQRSNLAATVLQLKAMGINDLLHFPFMDPPPAAVLVTALERLYALGALDDEGLLTPLGRKMAEFPLDPSLSKTLLAAVDLGCGEEVLSVVAMMSVDSAFFRPRDNQNAADKRHREFMQPEGDHISNLVVYNAWEKTKRSAHWCRQNFLLARNLTKAADVRKQLVGIMERHRLPVVSCGQNYNLVRKAVVSGYFMNVAKRDPKEGYKTLVEGQPVDIHPSSALFSRKPQLVLYHEVIRTSKEYMRGIMAIESRWLVELAPRFFARVDATKMTRSKRREKLEPLFDPHNPADAWRISKRRYA